MQDYKYDLALSTYRGITGDYETTFSTVEEIHNAIRLAIDNDGDVTIIRPLATDITENGTYEFKKQDNIDAYEPVTINVNIDNEAVYNQGYNSGYEEGESNQKSKLEDIEITNNGTYSKEDGYKNVTVKVPAELDFSIIGYDSELSKELNNDFQADVDYSKSLYDKYGGVLSGNVSNLFKDDTNLVYCPNFDTSNVIDTRYMFHNCINLKSIPLLDTGSVTNMISMFESCTNLTKVPLLNTSNVANMSRMFYRCTNLTTVPQLDASSSTDTSYMFIGCTNLQTIPQLNTGNVTNMYAMFESCTNLTTIPQLDTSKVTNMVSMFESCTNLTTIPLLDTSKLPSMSRMFHSCTNLTTIPLLDAGNVTNMGYVFYNCKALADVGGFKDLGKYENLSTTSMFSSTNNLTHDSIMNIINNLYDRAAAGYSAVTLPIGSTNLGKISDEEKAIATNKGWTLS